MMRMARVESPRASRARAASREMDVVPPDPCADEEAAVAEATSALSVAKDDLRLAEKRTEELTVQSEVSLTLVKATDLKGRAASAPKRGAASKANPGLDTEAQAEFDAAHAEGDAAQAAASEAKQRVRACRTELAAAALTLRHRRHVQLAERLDLDAKAQGAAFHLVLRKTGAELTAEEPRRAAAIEAERRHGAAAWRARERQEEAEMRGVIDPDRTHDRDALHAKFRPADFATARRSDFALAAWPRRPFAPSPRALFRDGRRFQERRVCKRAPV